MTLRCHVTNYMARLARMRIKFDISKIFKRVFFYRFNKLFTNECELLSIVLLKWQVCIS